jgi:hypothetical protein
VDHVLNSEVVLDFSGAALFAVSAKGGVLVLRFFDRHYNQQKKAGLNLSKPIPPFAKTAKSGAPVKSKTQLRNGIARGSAVSCDAEDARKKGGPPAKQRKRNEVAMVAKHWRRVPRGTCGTGRNACATGKATARTRPR